MQSTDNKNEAPTPPPADCIPALIPTGDPRRAAACLFAMAGHYLDAAHKLSRARHVTRQGNGVRGVPAGWTVDKFGPWEPKDTAEGNLEKGGALAFAAIERLLTSRKKRVGLSTPQSPKSR